MVSATTPGFFPAFTVKTPCAPSPNSTDPSYSLTLSVSGNSEVFSSRNDKRLLTPDEAKL
jgi:hypothetical protein